MINNIRSVLFTFCLVFGSLAISILLLPLLLLPRRIGTPWIAGLYGAFIAFVEKYVLGLKLEMRGLEHLPQDHRYIIAAKHQSAYETLKLPFMARLRHPVIVLKKELIWLPVWGLYPPRMGEIAVDRKAGAQALQQMVDGIRRAFDEGRPFAIFPEGTRKAPDAAPDYKPGLAKLYRDLKVPVVPMALNSGVFWGRNSFFKKGGTVVFEFLPPLPADMPPLKMMQALEEQVETATARLVAEARAEIAAK